MDEKKKAQLLRVGQERSLQGFGNFDDKFNASYPIGY